MKRYDSVTVNHLRAPSGRESLTEDFRRDKRAERRVCAEVCELAKSLPEDQAALIFTFKTRSALNRSLIPVDFQRVLREDMEAAGINLQQTVAVQDEQGHSVERERFAFLTWGDETSISKYAYCKHVIFAGVLHRSHLDIAASIVGQRNDLWGDVPSSMIREVLVSEIAHGLYQAMSRGACRLTTGSEAHAMDAWLIHGNDEVRPLLEKAMPGLNWKPWNGRHLTKPQTKEDVVIGAVLDYLRGLPETTRKVSTRLMKVQAGLCEVPSRVFTNAVQKIAKADPDWKLQGRSLVRTFDAYFEESNLNAYPL